MLCEGSKTNFTLLHSKKKLIFVLKMMNKIEKNKKTSRARHRNANSDYLGASTYNYSHGPEETKDLDVNLYAKFVNFLNQSRLQNLKSKINYFYGRNFPIQYQRKYNFKEQWQDNFRKQQNNLYDVMHNENNLIQLIFFLITIANSYVIWALTVSRIFSDQQNFDRAALAAISLGIGGRIASGGLNIFKKYQTAQTALNQVTIIKIVFWDLASIMYFILYSTGIYTSPLVILLEISVTIYLYIQARDFYKRISLIRVSLVYQYKYKILDLMINIVVIAHFCSLIMYMSSWNNEGASWVISAGIQDGDYLTKYLYSFYFCSTTILTIGYGDISPKNKLEITFVTILQYFGVVAFGHLVNEIGHTLSIMRKNEESLQKDLRVLGRIDKFYKLDPALANRAKNYLINNDSAPMELTPEEETNLLGKFNDELRSNIIFEKSLSVIKSSIFFLCRWTIDMQNNVASKLQKALLAPNERVIQPVNNERLYIIKRGKIDIYIDRFGLNRRSYRRLLKSIIVTETDEIKQNAYGYTSVISTRPCALDAVASDFTSCFYISKEDFNKCVNKCQLDREYYHQIKTKLQLADFCQAYQTPAILNIREHYNPSKTIMIRKQNARLSKLDNRRSTIIRNDTRRTKSHYFKNMIKLVEEINDKLFGNSNQYINCSTLTDQNEPTNVNDFNDCEGYFTIDDDRKNTVIQRKRHQSSEEASHYPNKNALGSKLDICKLMSTHRLNAQFEKQKEYLNYFSMNNISEGMKRLQNENYNSLHKNAEGNIHRLSTVLSFGFKNK